MTGLPVLRVEYKKYQSGRGHAVKVRHPVTLGTHVYFFVLAP